VSKRPWKRNYELCEKCWHCYEKKQYCPVCSKVWFARKSRKGPPMVLCDGCQLWVHFSCDNIDDQFSKTLATNFSHYYCPKCRQQASTNQKLGSVWSRVRSALQATAQHRRMYDRLLMWTLKLHKVRELTNLTNYSTMT